MLIQAAAPPAPPVPEPPIDQESNGTGDATSSFAAPTADAGIRRTLRVPQQLGRLNHYLICSRDKLVALWTNDGHSWTIKSGTGFLSAKRNSDKLPNQGSFALVELRIDVHEGSHRPVGITSYRLNQRWALPVLARGDDEILGKIVGPGSLSREQKIVVMSYLRETFMAEVWRQVPDLVDYLTNTDYHSQSVGESSPVAP